MDRETLLSRWVSALPVALAVAVTAGCGGGSTARSTAPRPTASGVSSPSASSATSAPSTAAAAMARATAIGLRPTDAPGFTAMPRAADPGGAAANAALTTCLGGASASPSGPRRTNLANLDSDAFTRGTGLDTQQLSSNVTIVRSPIEARSDLAGFTGPRARHCIGAFVDTLLRGLAGSGITFGRTEVMPLSTTAPASLASFGYRVTVSGVASGAPTHFYVDVFGFIAGTTEVSLTTLSIGDLFPARTEQVLFGLLAHRAATTGS